MQFEPPPNKQHYYEQVWALVRTIPAGCVATYGQITREIPQPEGISVGAYKMSASRWVGLAMAACPDDVPWQRVVNSQGKISHPEAGKQKHLLVHEGVLFIKDKIDLNDFQWHGPKHRDHIDKPRQGRLF